MSDTSATLPANIKPNTLTAYVWELGQKDNKMPMATMREAVQKKFPGRDFSDTTLHALRSQFGIRERGRSTPPNTKSAAPKKGGRGTKKGTKRGPYKKTNGNGHNVATTTQAIMVPDAVKAFRQLVARIGTDAAEKILSDAKVT
jgi:hypothetical protein